MRKLTATILVSILLGGLVLSCSGDKGLQSEPVTVADESLAGLTCEGQDNGIVGVGTVGGIAVTKSNRAGVGTFPNIVGSYWMYDVIDTVSGEEIEVSVTITEELLLYGSIPVSVWSYATDHEILGTEYVGVDDNTVSFYRYEPTQDTIYKFREIVFPLYVGKTWSFMVNRGAEYYSIPASPLVTVPAGDFSTYQVHANYRSGMLDAVSVSDLWFSPNVGFVKLDKVTGWRQTINSHEIWELVDYHVVPPLAHLIR